MRTGFGVFILALSAICSAQLRAQAGPGCGPDNVKFDVKTTTRPQPAPASQPGKALVYFLQDEMKYRSSPRPTTRFGIDGTWVGATHANSYFWIFVNAGEHHVCASWQTQVTVNYGDPRSTAAGHFNFEPGKSYFLRASDIAKGSHGGGIPSVAEVRLSPVNSDEAQVLMNSFSFSFSHAQN